MFRELQRKNKALSLEECIALLKSEKRGVLSVNGQDGYPYGMPMNFFYDEEQKLLWFHCGRGKGHRADAIRESDKASFCLMAERGKDEHLPWADRFESLVVFGRIKVVDDEETVSAVCRRLSEKFTSDGGYVEKEIADFGKATLLLALSVEHLCGKRITEA